MAFDFLNMLSAQWQGRGLQHLLMPEDFDALAPGQNRTAKRPSRSTHSSARTKKIQPAKKTQADSPAQPEAGKSILPVRQWPPRWRELWQQARPGKVLWSYAQLGSDLLYEETVGRAERGAFLARLLRDMGHPVGTHSFWPTSLPARALDGAAGAKGDVDPAPEIFWAAVQLLKVRGIVIMGTPVMDALGLPAGQPPQQMQRGKYILWHLWDLETLCSSQTRYSTMLAFLRRALRIVL